MPMQKEKAVNDSILCLAKPAEPEKNTDEVENVSDIFKIQKSKFRIIDNYFSHFSKYKLIIIQEQEVISFNYDKSYSAPSYLFY